MHPWFWTDYDRLQSVRCVKCVSFSSDITELKVCIFFLHFGHICAVTSTSHTHYSVPRCVFPTLDTWQCCTVWVKKPWVHHVSCMDGEWISICPSFASDFDTTLSGLGFWQPRLCICDFGLRITGLLLGCVVLVMSHLACDILRCWVVSIRIYQLSWCELTFEIHLSPFSSPIGVVPLRVSGFSTASQLFWVPWGFHLRNVAMHLGSDDDGKHTEIIRNPQININKHQLYHQTSHPIQYMANIGYTTSRSFTMEPEKKA